MYTPEQLEELIHSAENLLIEIDLMRSINEHARKLDSNVINLTKITAGINPELSALMDALEPFDVVVES